MEFTFVSQKTEEEERRGENEHSPALHKETLAQKEVQTAQAP